VSNCSCNIANKLSFQILAYGTALKMLTINLKLAAAENFFEQLVNTYYTDAVIKYAMPT